MGRQKVCSEESRPPNCQVLTRRVGRISHSHAKRSLSVKSRLPNTMGHSARRARRSTAPLAVLTLLASRGDGFCALPRAPTVSPRSPRAASGRIGGGGRRAADVGMMATASRFQFGRLAGRGSAPLEEADPIPVRRAGLTRQSGVRARVLARFFPPRDATRLSGSRGFPSHPPGCACA